MTQVVTDIFGGPPKHIDGIPDKVLWEWRYEYRELNEDRMGWCVLWEPFVREKMAAYQQEATR